MPKWVTRLSKTGAQVSATRKCSESNVDGRESIMHLEACINELLEPGEALGGRGFQRPIVKDSAIVGFIEIIDHPPWHGKEQGTPSWPSTRS
jgi:hypothetical protein